MIHNSWTGEFECAAAYFALHDDGIDPHLTGGLTTGQWALHRHWEASRRPDAFAPEGVS